MRGASVWTSGGRERRRGGRGTTSGDGITTTTSGAGRRRARTREKMSGARTTRQGGTVTGSRGRGIDVRQGVVVVTENYCKEVLPTPSSRSGCFKGSAADGITSAAAVSWKA